LGFPESFEGERVVKTVKVTEETHKRLLKVVETLQSKEGKKKTVEDAVVYLLDEYERIVSILDEHEKRNKDRRNTVSVKSVS